MKKFQMLSHNESSSHPLDEESLSSLSDDEDNCIEDNSQKIFRVVLSLSPYMHFFDMQPWREAIDVIDLEGTITFQENSSQTEFTEIIVTNAIVQLEPIVSQDAELQVDDIIIEANNTHNYEESAFERILRYLSKKKYKNELTEWYKDEPNTSLNFCMTPISKYAEKILAAEYNEASQIFLLLVEGEEEITLELRTLGNLLYAEVRKMDMKRDDEIVCLSTVNNLVAVSCGRKIIVQELNKNSTIISLTAKENIISAKIFEKNVTWITVDGCIWQQQTYGTLSRRIGWMPLGLGSHIFHCCISKNYLYFLTETSAIICCYKDCSDFEFIETNEKFTNTDKIIPLDDSSYIIFRCKLLKAELWRYNEPRYYTHELQFSNTEQVVDFCWYNSYLYSLTNNGEISIWRFLLKRRKQRVWAFMSNVNNCVRLLSIAEHVCLFLFVKKRKTKMSLTRWTITKRGEFELGYITREGLKWDKLDHLISP